MAAPLRKVAKYAEPAALLMVVLGLAVVVTRRVLEATGGEPAVPLDDAYIHLNYARSFARGEPLVYSPGDAPTSGATSLSWVVLLAPFWALGVRELSLIWVTWALSWGCLGLLSWELGRAARGLLPDWGARAVRVLPLAFGPFAWFAASGMEVLLLGWLLLLAARLAADWWEQPGSVPRWQLLACGAAAALTRPEGVLAVAVVVAALFFRPGNRPRWQALPLLLAPALPLLVNLLATGVAVSATAQAKLLHTSPYAGWSSTWSAVLGNLQIFFRTLLNGDKWSWNLFPQGFWWLPVLGLGALLGQGVREKRVARALLLLVVGLGALLPTAYYTFLVNRLRYLWPFASVWLLGLACLLPALTWPLELWLKRPAWRRGVARTAALVGVAFFAVALGRYWSSTVDDLVTSSSAIHRQQVSLARWAKSGIPEGKPIGVNDAGAVAYLSGHPTVDLVGLTSRGFALPWRAGPGPRFEYWEKLGASELPPYLLVYPDWFAADPLLGDELSRRSVYGASILGAPEMVAYRARYDGLGSGDRPASVGGTIVDRLDVADLESERTHGYEIFFAHEGTSDVREYLGRVDGARTWRSFERFRMQVEPGARFIARLGADAPLDLQVWVGSRHVGDLTLRGYRWEEAELTLPADLERGEQTLTLQRRQQVWFAALHYWVVSGGGS